MENNINFKGTVQTANGTDMPILKTLGMTQVILKPGELLTPHLHPNANELAYFVSGTAEVAVYSVGAGDPGATPFQVTAGDVVFFPQGAVHYVHNTGKDDVDFILSFDNPNFDLLFVTDIFQQFDPAIFQQAFGVNGKVINAMTHGGGIVPAAG
jgi:oxalate decarboxylase